MLVDTSKIHNHEGFVDGKTEGGQSGEGAPNPNPNPNPAFAADGSPIGEGGGEGQPIDLKATFLDWSKEAGFNLAEDAIPDIKDESELKGLVSKTYAIEYAKQVDPFIADLLEKGIGLGDFQNQVQPLQEIVNQTADDMYTYVQYEREVEELLRLGKLTYQSTEEDYRAVWDKLEASTKAKMEGLTDEEKERLVQPHREKYKNDLSELTSGWQSKQQNAAKQKQEAYETQYKGELEQLVSAVEKLYSENKFTTPFGQPEKEPFKEFLQKQLAISDIEIEKDGKKSVERGIPFMHKLNTDEDFLVKVLTAVYQAEKGAISDAISRKVGEVVGGLRLTPLSKGGTVVPPTNQRSKLVNTAVPHTA